MTDLPRTLERLYGRVPLGMRLGLEPMQRACERFGHPERGYEIVHVAGTNGKGSVCAMTESILRVAGDHTGLYTSPHLLQFAERIQISGEQIDDTRLDRILDEVLTREPDLSFFEVATLTAFLAFREAKCDRVILEVGLGGRLDATNVIPTPRVAAITKIALDHTDRLGTTLSEIAREKAGIIKSGGRVVVGEMCSEVRGVIERVAGEQGATLASSVREDATEDIASVTLGLAGQHQRLNAAIAWTIGEELGVSRVARRGGLTHVSWPGRCEQLEIDRVTFILDGAHNPDGAEALATFVDALHKPPSQCALIFGALADKAWPEILDALAPLSGHRFFVAPQGRAAANPNELAARWPGTITHDLTEALTMARTRAPYVLVSGSLHLVGQARSELLGLPRDPPVAL